MRIFQWLHPSFLQRHRRQNGPSATLGPPVEIDLPRPRNRKALNHSPRFQQIRGEVIDYLLGSRRQPRTRTQAFVNDRPEPATVGASA